MNQYEHRYPLAHSDQDPWVDPLELQLANARHDAEMRDMHISTSGRLNASWNSSKLALRGELTDKKIKKYMKEGYYSAEYREARRKAMAKQSIKRGNFTEIGGRLIYNPT